MHGSQIGPSFRMRRAVSIIVIVVEHPKALSGLKTFYSSTDHNLYAFTIIILLYRAVITMSTISSKYQITLPSRVREKMGLKAGDRVVFVEDDDGFMLRKLDDLAAEFFESMKDFDETDREFRKGFRFREDGIDGNLL
jgi:AbrB family looped-hinge helix DNA binding protein